MKKINVVLLSHYYKDNNLGCVALSICNLQLIERAAKEAGIPVNFIIYVNEKQPHLSLDYIDSSYEYRVYSSSKQSVKHPIKLLTTNIFNDCDVAFNLCAGDGFTDIYGFGRVLSESYMTVIANKKGVHMVLAPQTIGPFDKSLNKKIAKNVMKRCDYIFTRDEQSTIFCGSLGFKYPIVNEVIDVAFALPFQPIDQEHDCENIGLNVSGLLYQGGYNHDNYFNLSFSYKEYVDKLIKVLVEKGKRVHLISHVITQDGSIEDDFKICKEIADCNKNVVLMPRRESPIEVKNYIAGMDVFIGARMHSTIGAFSAGIPVIPVAYSRKFNGLFNTLKYPYYIDAKGDYDVNSAIARTMEYIDRKDELKNSVDSARSIYGERIDVYVDKVKEILIERA